MDQGGGASSLNPSGTRENWNVLFTSPEGRTTNYRSENFLTEVADARSRTPTAPCRWKPRTRRSGRRRRAAPNGELTQTVGRDDPRFGMLVPIVSSVTTTPNGLSRVVATSRTATFTGPGALSLNVQTDETNINGRRWTRTYRATTKTYSFVSPGGRGRTHVIDLQGRTTRTQIGLLLPVDFFYDTSGRLDHVTQGARITQNAYIPTGAARGYLASITDATSTPTTFTRDALGRTLTETRSAATTAFGWDPLSNLASVTPPGKPIHEMNYTPVNLLESYEPPPTGLPASATGYTYDLDRMLRTETRPGGISIVRTPDSAGRLDTVAIPGGLIDYDYFPSERA